MSLLKKVSIAAISILLGNSALAMIGSPIASKNDYGQSSVVGLTSGGQVYCTGVLIDRRVVLTAAHCIVGGKMIVFFASNPSIKIEVIGGIRHPKYIQPTGDAKQSNLFEYVASGKNDIGLILLKDFAPESATIAELPNSLKLNEQTQIKTFGYGMSAQNQSPDGKLRTATLVGALDNQIPEKLIIDQNNGQGICFGDSGGPSFIRGKKQPMVISINSHLTSAKLFFGLHLGGNVCANKSVVELVAPKISWINQTSQRMLSGEHKCKYNEEFRFYVENELRFSLKKGFELLDLGKTKDSDQWQEVHKFEIRGFDNQGREKIMRLDVRTEGAYCLPL